MDPFIRRLFSPGGVRAAGGSAGRSAAVGGRAGDLELPLKVAV
ncbi:MAG TPA: hypothetical protein PKA10_09590 [Selenomonadales bacterium]|nr:hypothetical protein [Selenomonadales bacterium]